MKLNFFTKRPKKVGLSLRGGGARTHAYLGVFKLLEELDIPIHSMVASSGGAVIGGAYAAGISVEEIYKHSIDLKGYTLTNLKAIRNLKPWDYTKAVGYLRELIGEKRIEDLPIKLHIQLTNQETFNNHIISEGDLAYIIAASSAHTLLMEPIQIEGEYYVDGDYSSGYAANFLKNEGCDVVIGCKAGSMPYEKPNSLNEVGRTIGGLIQNVHQRDVRLDPPDMLLTDLGGGIGDVTEFKKAKEFMEYGYERALEFKDEIIKITGY